MTRTVTRRQAIAGGVAAVAAATVPGTALANHQDSDDADPGFFSGSVVGGEDGIRARMLAFPRGRVSRTRLLLFGDLDDAEEIAVDIQGHINEHSEDYREYVNERDLGGEDREVFELTIEQDGDSSTLYLVAEYDDADGEYTSIEMYDAAAYEDEHGGREADEVSELSGHAAAEAPDELDRFHAEFVEPGDDVTHAYATEMAATYSGDHVSSTLLGDDL